MCIIVDIDQAATHHPHVHALRTWELFYIAFHTNLTHLRLWIAALCDPTSQSEWSRPVTNEVLTPPLMVSSWYLPVSVSFPEKSLGRMLVLMQGTYGGGSGPPPDGGPISGTAAALTA